jgi:hypothetical protein
MALAGEAKLAEGVGRLRGLLFGIEVQVTSIFKSSGARRRRCRGASPASGPGSAGRALVRGAVDRQEVARVEGNWGVAEDGAEEDGGFGESREVGRGDLPAG